MADKLLRKKVKRTCVVCGKSFEIWQAWLKRPGDGKYCSRECADKGRHTGEVLTCEVCGKKFYAPKNRLGTQHFCSKKCMGIAMSQKQNGTDNPYWRGGQQERKCEYCGKTFLTYGYRGTNIRFCSSECDYASREADGNSNWRGGKSFEPYPMTFNAEFKCKVRERDRYTCAICGKHPARVVHHINYVKDDTIPNNCITLCGICHGKTNFQRVYWQDRLQKVVREWLHLE